MKEYENIDFDKLLNDCFEIEGLISLMRLREAETPEEVHTLLKLKVQALASQLGAGEAEAEDCKEALSEEKADDEAIAAAAEFEESNDADMEIHDGPSLTEIDEAEAESAEADDYEVEMSVEAKLARESSTDLRQAFSLNDKYRFRRELFGNSEADFRDALDMLSAMRSYAEAEEYLYGDLHWDREGDDVKDFMAIVRNHFSA